MCVYVCMFTTTSTFIGEKQIKKIVLKEMYSKLKKNTPTKTKIKTKPKRVQVTAVHIHKLIQKEVGFKVENFWFCFLLLKSCNLPQNLSTKYATYYKLFKASSRNQK